MDTASNQTEPNLSTPISDQTQHGPSKSLLIIAGFGTLLILVAVTILFLKSPTNTSLPTSVTPTEQPQELTLNLESPTDGTLAVENEMVISGTTLPGITVAIFTETDEIIVESDVFGQFETTISLASGINSLNVTAYSADGQEKSVSLNVVYDEEV